MECDHAPFAATTHLRIHLRTELNVYAQDASLTWERRRGQHEVQAKPVEPPVVNLTPTVEPPLRCDECSYTTNPAKKQPAQALRMHKRTHVSPEPVAAGV